MPDVTVKEVLRVWAEASVASVALVASGWGVVHATGWGLRRWTWPDVPDLLSLIGLLMVLWGIYRTTPLWQERLSFVQAPVRRWLHRRGYLKPTHVAVHASTHLTVASAVRGYVTPLPPDPAAADLREVVEWVDDRLDRLNDRVTAEAVNARKERTRMSGRIRDVSRDLQKKKRDLEREVQSSRIPDRMERYGAVLALAGQLGKLLV